MPPGLIRSASTALSVLVMAAVPAASSTWDLETTTLTYAVSHPLHHIEGVSRSAKGKGRSDATAMHFLVAVPVRSFDSGDSNRDSHMLEVTRAALHPMIVVRVTVPLAAESRVSGTLLVDATVEFAGSTMSFPALALVMVGAGAGRLRVSGVIPLSLKALAIAPPSLLAMPVSDEVPVTLDLVWKRRPD